jgi:hypothetical protein
LTSSSPAYSDISDEEPTTTTTTTITAMPHEQMLSPSTINLLTGAHGTLDDKGNHIPSTTFLSSNSGLNHADMSNPNWRAQMLFQQFGSYMSQSDLVSSAATVVPSNHKETSKKQRSTTPNGYSSNEHRSNTNTRSTLFLSY